LTTITDEKLAEALAALNADELRQAKIRATVRALKADYTYEPRLPLDESVMVVDTIFRRIPDGARLFVILPYEWMRSDDALRPRPVAVEYNDAIRELARRNRAVTLVAMNDLVAGTEDMQGAFDLFDRMVYYRIYRRILRELSGDPSPPRPSGYRSMP